MGRCATFWFRSAGAAIFLLAARGECRAPDSSAQFAALLPIIVAADMRLEAIGFRLTTANATLCPRPVPSIGIRLHSLDQYEPAYRPDAKRYFGFEQPVTIEGMVAKGPGENAGLRAGDAITQIGVQVFHPAEPSNAQRATTNTLALAYGAISAQPYDRPLTLRIVRQGQAATVNVTPLAACPTRFELVLGRRYLADADGQIVRIGYGFLERLDDTELAVVVAHELAHNLLGHAARMDTEGIGHGLAAEIGRSAAALRRMEDEADRMSLCLLVNAGYDRGLPASFWRASGRRIEGFGPRTGSHHGWRARAALFDEAARQDPCDGLRPAG